MILPDFIIRNLSTTKGMIVPFSEAVSGGGIISYGVSSLGYDVRVSNKWALFQPAHNAVMDPKNHKKFSAEMVEADEIILAPHSYVLATTIERFKIPDNVLGIVLGKSTYCRCGLVVNCSPLEPGWEGDLTLEISNPTVLPIRIYANEGIAQVIFFVGVFPPEVTYSDKKGKYQGQFGITLPMVK